MSDRFIPLTPGSDMNQLLAILNKNFGELDGEATTKVFRTLNGNPGFVEGKLPNDLGYGFILYTSDGKAAIACYIDSSGNPILKVAKDGFDATTASNDQLIFNSGQNILKIVATGTTSMSPLAGTDTSVIVTHSLGYIPIANVFVDTGGSYSPVPGNGSATLIDSSTSPPRTYNIQWYSYIVSATELQIICWNAGVAFGSVNFRYLLLQESIN